MKKRSTHQSQPVNDLPEAANTCGSVAAPMLNVVEIQCIAKASGLTSCSYEVAFVASDVQ